MRRNVFIALLLFISIVGHSQWGKICPLQDDYKGIAFTDANNGFIVGAGGTFLRTTNNGLTWTKYCVNTKRSLNAICFPTTTLGIIVADSCTILRTVDGGSNWGITILPGTLSLNSVFFVNASMGYVVGSGGKIFKTVDGGVSWTDKSVASNYDLLSVSFIDANVGIAAGDIYLGGGFILKTTDGGTTWNSVLTTAQNEARKACCFVSATDGYCTGKGGRVFKTTNAGDTWTQVSYAGGWDYSSIQFTDANTGYMAYFYGIMKTINGGSTWTTYNSGNGNTFCYFRDQMNGYSVGFAGFISKTVNAALTWTAYQVGGVSGYVRSVFFTSSTIGHATGQGGGTMLKTTDGGINWTSQAIGPTQSLVSVYFPSPTTGYAVGVLGTIVKTTNGGGSWSDISAGLPAIAASADFQSVWFTSNDTGYIVGKTYVTPYMGLLYTTNGGSSWTHIPLPTGNYHHFRSVCFPSKNVGYITGETNPTMKTTDGGATWVELAAATSGGSALYFVNDTLGFQAYAWTDGKISRTINGGVSWTNQQPTSKGLLSIRFFDESYGTAAGVSGTILNTSNGGNSWVQDPCYVTNQDLYGVSYSPSGDEYIVGHTVVLKRSVPSNPTSVGEIFQVEDFVIYPNPNQGMFVIETREKDLNLIIHTILGEQVYFSAIDSERTVVDISNKPSGIYFIELRGERSSSFRKVVKQ